LHDKSDNYIFNIFTCLLVMIYGILFCIYVITGFSIGWVWGQFIATGFMIWLNIMCYKEKYRHRNHRLT